MGTDNHTTNGTDSRTDTRPPARLIDTRRTGLYATQHPVTGTVEVHLVRWNRARTARYALALRPPRTPGDRFNFEYEGQAPLHDLTVDDAVPVSMVLRRLAAGGPYDVCAFCQRSLEDALPRTFGVGERCAERHLGVRPVILRAVHARLPGVWPPSRPPTGPGTPVVARGHLRLVAVDGELVGAA